MNTTDVAYVQAMLCTCNGPGTGSLVQRRTTRPELLRLRSASEPPRAAMPREWWRREPVRPTTSVQPNHLGRTVGGHLAEGCTVRTTAEVVLAADEQLLFAREHDPATGYDELVVREREP